MAGQSNTAGRAFAPPTDTIPNLKEDATETTDLSQTNARKTKELEALYVKWNNSF